MKRVCIVVVITSAFVLVPLAGQINSPLFLYEKSELVIETEDGATATFKVVVVTRSEDLAQGLMNVQFMPLDQGMVFLHSTKREVSMWMKNTHVSLDMWFVSETGLVTRVVSKTQPESTDLIRSGGPVLAVVEVNAGLSSLIGVTAGAQLRHRVFSNVSKD
ncbi:MAG: DUF192 domain-containing protein [Gammaproteobacteria bacterium]|nr:DUF192 domain-containing protein [Gammaproteobacteria bacterium]MYD80472.1 DUF192 domain-containing protein [Gammaproteobacteria bacterium]